MASSLSAYFPPPQSLQKYYGSQKHNWLLIQKGIWLQALIPVHKVNSVFTLKCGHNVYITDHSKTKCKIGEKSTHFKDILSR